jgi:hypothetical protein
MYFSKEINDADMLSGRVAQPETAVIIAIVIAIFLKVDM